MSTLELTKFKLDIFSKKVFVINFKGTWSHL